MTRGGRPTARGDGARCLMTRGGDARRPTAHGDGGRQTTTRDDDAKCLVTRGDDGRRTTTPLSRGKGARCLVAHDEGARRPTARGDDGRRPMARVEGARRPTSRANSARRPMACGEGAGCLTARGEGPRWSTKKRPLLLIVQNNNDTHSPRTISREGERRSATADAAAGQAQKSVSRTNGRTGYVAAADVWRGEGAEPRCRKCSRGAVTEISAPHGQQGGDVTADKQR